jgi:phosphate transport system substrate-binding protein
MTTNREKNMNLRLALKRICGLVLVGLIVFSCTGCGKGKKSITLAGSTAFQPFAEKLAEKYMQINPTVNITVQGGGSAVGIQSALSGAADIGMADLVNLPPQAAALRSVVVAKDGIVVVVHPSNQVDGLTLDQVRGLVNGKIRNWKEVGGPDAPVTVVSREAGSGTRSSFEQIVGNVALTDDAIIQDSNGTIRETVANDANALGYLSHGLLNEKIKALAIDGVACTSDEIMQGRYRLIRPIFFLTKIEPKGDLAGFIDYVLSPDAQKILQTSGLIPAK